MSSGTSTESPAIPAVAPDRQRQSPRPRGAGDRRSDALEPWQLFTLAGLVGATLVVFLARGQSPAAVILLSLVIFAAAAVGIAALRMVAPLAGRHTDESPQALGERARAALEREKALVLRSIKELEFDRAMGKVSDRDFEEMSVRLRSRAVGLMRQMDAGGGYRELIQREIAMRAATVPAPATAATAAPVAPPDGRAAAGAPVCAVCEVRNDADARFCKACGAALRPAE